jgi:hypothetical protein
MVSPDRRGLVGQGSIMIAAANNLAGQGQMQFAQTRCNLRLNDLAIARAD